MTAIQPDMWTPQRWSHADVVAMQARLDPARMTGYADHWRRVLDEAVAVFTRLDADVTRHLDESWRGHGARQALESLRRYISESVDGLARCRMLADSLDELSAAAGELRAAVDEIPAPPAVPGASAPPLSALPVPSATATVPAGYGAPMPSPGHEATWPGGSPLPFRRNGFDDYASTASTHTAGSPPPPPPTPLVGGMRTPDSPLPPATLNAATMPMAPPAAPAQSAASPQPRGGVPYLPLMGAAYPGAIGRNDGATRRTPGYLISIDNGNELIGPLPKVAPPVLGDW